MNSFDYGTHVIGLKKERPFHLVSDDVRSYCGLIYKYNRAVNITSNYSEVTCLKCINSYKKNKANCA